MNRALTEKEIVKRIDEAIKKGHISAAYQTQVNCSNYRITGMEALLRWSDPECGLQETGDIIPVLEKNGLIFKADLHIFEEVCRFQRRCLDEGIYAVPISVNMSRYDIREDASYVDSIEAIRKKYDIPVYYLRVEINESFADEGKEKILPVLEKLHEAGYVVVMDDFGRGCTSLNALRDFKIDVLKLDMGFLSDGAGERSGKIINALVQMAKWLNTPVIAERVETTEQALFMQSIGCYYNQGYLYNKPEDEDTAIRLLKDGKHESLAFNYKSFGALQDNSLWNPGASETLLFNRFAGPSAIVTYRNGEVNVLRVNQKYIAELGMQHEKASILNANPLDSFFPEEREKYKSVLENIIKTYSDEECETWRSLESQCCGEDRVCIRSVIQLIGSMSDEYMFFVTIRNITAEKEARKSLEDNLKKFEMASDQNNTFSWEYDVSTHEMRPCSRCRRVLGLPAVLQNYPEPLIESGLFPAEVADMYRDLMKQLDNGAESIEAVIPLTADKVPFHIRYTAEFDENGRPYKAYGSATQVVEK
ncbi:MAG: EAL domain-containing protein [Lachnospiraceae bacterium]|nr:EAL domain-containing protein [Lachnospiraceae bacterium]